MCKGSAEREAERMNGRVAAEMKDAIRRIPDWPKKGVVFRDITTLWKDAKLLKASTDILRDHFKGKRIDKVLGIEARGFIVGAPLAEKLGVGFVPARKGGKLPSEKVTERYSLEYSDDGLEVHKDAIRRGERVLVVDDLIATAGTALATVRLVERLAGVVVGFAFLVELAFLNGREKLGDYDVFSIVRYDSEAE